MEIIGYFEEYYINKKFIGNKVCEKQEREIGFKEMKNNIAFENIVLDNKKIIFHWIGFFDETCKWHSRRIPLYFEPQQQQQHNDNSNNK
jgi:hypothetical protein